MQLLEALRWRYATKKFDPQKKVPEALVESILNAGNLTATSYGLQPYQFVVVQNQELQDKLVAASYGQSQVADASHVIVIATRTDVDEAFISDYVSMTETARDLEPGTLDGYKKFMSDTIGRMPVDVQKEWAAKQTYIVIGTMMAACAALEIDCCPMEGFVPEQYDALLDLSELNLRAAVVLPIGYRSEEDQTQHQAKVRRPLNEMIVRK